MPLKKEFDPVAYVRAMLGQNAALVWKTIRSSVQKHKESGDASNYMNGFWWTWASYDLWIQDKEIAKHGLTRGQFKTAIKNLKQLKLVVVERHRREGKLFGFYRTIEPSNDWQ